MQWTSHLSWWPRSITVWAPRYVQTPRWTSISYWIINSWMLASTLFFILIVINSSVVFAACECCEMLFFVNIIQRQWTWRLHTHRDSNDLQCVTYHIFDAFVLGPKENVWLPSAPNVWWPLAVEEWMNEWMKEGWRKKSYDLILYPGSNQDLTMGSVDAGR